MRLGLGPMDQHPRRRGEGARGSGVSRPNGEGAGRRMAGGCQIKLKKDCPLFGFVAWSPQSPAGGGC